MNIRYTLDEQGGAVFRLKDYLSPGNRYPYNDLPNDLEAARRQGLAVSLLSVPGFLMVGAFPDAPGKRPSKKPWWTSSMGKFREFATAREALKNR